MENIQSKYIEFNFIFIYRKNKYISFKIKLKNEKMSYRER